MDGVSTAICPSTSATWIGLGYDALAGLYGHLYRIFAIRLIKLHRYRIEPEN